MTNLWNLNRRCSINHMNINFTEGYHPLVSMSLLSVHKWPISHEHYRQINPSITKKTTSYIHVMVS